MNCTENYPAAKRKFFCAFLTLGYPDIKTTKRLIKSFEKSGVDIIELGFPFSDPLADGPTIQFSSEAALKNKIQMRDAFDLVSELRREGVNLPVLFFSYFNPIFHHGPELFAKQAARAGFDGVVIPDLPPNEESGFTRALDQYGLSPVYLIAPTSHEKRVDLIVRKSQGFIYYVSLKGVTGARRSLASDIEGHLRQIKKKTKKPVLVGFGVSSPEQAASLARISDGVIVGSAIIDKIRNAKGNPEAAERYIREMVAAVKGSKNAGSAGS